MSEGCTHNCETCGEACASRQGGAPQDMREAANPNSKIKKVIGVVSGKGGVGKSLVSGMLAVEMRRREHNVGILDADVTGPSIPKMFGLKTRAVGNELGILPVETRTGIKVMSVNLLLEHETDPVVWRGPVIAGTVTQFWTDVVWGDVDFLFVDMPPGTGDVALTVFQSLPVDGIVIVASPQDLVSMIVEKAVNMAGLMNVPILGLVENMSDFTCPDCGKKISVFGESHIEEIAAAHNLPVLGKLPIDPGLAKQCDMGVIEAFEGNYLAAGIDALEALLEK